MPANRDNRVWLQFRRHAGISCILVASLCQFAPVQSSIAQQNASSPSGIADYQVKAAYLYKFGSYIEWPGNTFATAESPLTIGVRGADPLANELIRIAVDHTINGRPVIVRKLGSEDPLTGINVLFIGNEVGERDAELLTAAKGSPILTVTESQRALERGSMINFVLVDSRVRFEAAPKTAKQNNLTISARLLAAAYRVAAEGT